MAVYFAQAGAYIKIGYSRRPFSRLSTVTLNGARPADLPRGADADLIGWVPGDRTTEAEWHIRFAADRIGTTEWFYLEPSVVRELIWADPCGVDVQRMSALAVLTADDYPGVSRYQIAAAGIRVDAATFDEAVASFGAQMTAARNAVAATKERAA